MSKGWIYLYSITHKAHEITVYEVDFLHYGFRVNIDGEKFELIDHGLIKPVAKCRQFIDAKINDDGDLEYPDSTIKLPTIKGKLKPQTVRPLHTLENNGN